MSDSVPENTGFDQVDNFVSAFYSDSNEETLDTDEEEDMNFYNLYDDCGSPRPSSPNADDELLDDTTDSDDDMSDNRECEEKYWRRNSDATVKTARRSIASQIADSNSNPQHGDNKLRKENDSEGTSGNKEQS